MSKFFSTNTRFGADDGQNVERERDRGGDANRSSCAQDPRVDKGNFPGAAEGSRRPEARHDSVFCWNWHFRSLAVNFQQSACVSVLLCPVTWCFRDRTPWTYSSKSKEEWADPTLQAQARACFHKANGWPRIAQCRRPVYFPQTAHCEMGSCGSGLFTRFFYS